MEQNHPQLSKLDGSHFFPVPSMCLGQMPAEGVLSPVDKLPKFTRRAILPASGPIFSPLYQKSFYADSLLFLIAQQECHYSQNVLATLTVLSLSVVYSQSMLYLSFIELILVINNEIVT